MNKKRQLLVDDELKAIAQEIIEQKWTIQEWAAHESGDWFQTENYCGGFEAEDDDNGEFAFAKYPATEKEFWFSFTYDSAEDIASGKQTTVIAYDAI